MISSYIGLEMFTTTKVHPSWAAVKMFPPPSAPVMCFFCKTKFPDSELESHMKQVHQMMDMFIITPKVLCLLCKEEVEESNLEKHVREVHEIFGLQANNDQAETSTQTQYDLMKLDVTLRQRYKLLYIKKE